MKRVKTDRVINSIFLILYAAMVGVCLYVVRFIVPSADDYSNSLDVNHYIDLGYSRMKAVLIMVREGYMNNQGTWFSSILHFLPLSFRELYSYEALRIYMCAADLFFFVSAAFFVYWFCRRYLTIRYWGLFLLIASFCAMNHASPSETLYWMNGACVYTIPMACAFLASGAFVAWLENPDNGWMIRVFLAASMLFGIPATGGNLTIAGFLCAVTASLALCELMTGRGKPIVVLMPLICIAGSLVNALAPGNFSRHERYVAYGTLTIADSLKNTVVIIHHRLMTLITQGFLIAAIISVVGFLIMIGCYQGGIPGREKRTTNPLIVMICGYGCIYATFFPMVLGYNMIPEDYVMAPRMAFISGWVIVVVVAFVAAYTTLWIRDLGSRPGENVERTRYRVIVSLAIIAATYAINFVLLYDPVESDMYLFTMERELRAGTLSEAYKAQREVLDEIKQAHFFDVVTIDRYIPASKILKGLDLNDDPTWWVNVATGQFYEYKTVIYISPVGM